MKINITNYTAGEILKLIRKHSQLNQTQFASKINKSRDWQYTNESNKSNYYIVDLMLLSKIFKFKIIIEDVNNNRKINLNDYKPNEVLKIIREWSGKSQKDFASAIGKTLGWQHYNETAKTKYYTNDLIKLINFYNFELFIEFKI